MGWVLVEILMMGLAKIPFTCTYLPGRSRVGTLWSLYLSGFITYAYTTAAWEAQFIAEPRPVAIFVLVISAVIAVLTLRRHRYLSEMTGFRFQEEEPGAVFAGFQLSEGFAAASETARKLR